MRTPTKPVLQGRVIIGRVPQKPPTGSAYPVTPEWQESVRNRLTELGWNQSDLARAASSSSAMVAYLLKHGVQSRLVPAIHKALGWPPPALPSESMDYGEDDPMLDALADIYDAMSDQQRALFLRAAEVVKDSPIEVLEAFLSLIKVTSPRSEG